MLEYKPFFCYNSSMTYKNIFKNSAVKQVIGALAGMAVAGLLYIGIDQTSSLNIKGLLVSTDSITGNAGDIRINATDVNDATIRRLTSRANAIADQLASSASAASSSHIAETPLSNNVEARRAKRVFAHEVAENFASAPTYANDPNRVMSVKERIDIRAANLAGLPLPSFAPQPLGVNDEAPPLTVSAGVTVSTDTAETTSASSLRPAATMEPPSASSLPSSGLGLHLLVLLSIGCAFFSVKTHARDRIVALVRAHV